MSQVREYRRLREDELDQAEQLAAEGWQVAGGTRWSEGLGLSVWVWREVPREEPE